MTRHLRLLGLCLLALSGCVTEYKLVSDGNSQPDGGDPGDGDGDGDTGDGDGDGDGDGVTGGSGGNVVPGDGDGNDTALCAGSSRCGRIQVGPTDRLDLLFMVDNSFSMEQEQESLREQFPRLINILTSGDRTGDGEQDFAPAKDIHFGVVSSDLGLPGLEGARIENCGGLGDEGRLLNEASPELFSQGVCSQQVYTPPFLAFSADVTDQATREQTANDLACIASIGIDGCGFEQQLESMLKAVWPGSDQSVTFVTDTAGFGMFGMAGPGFPNGEFIRNNPNESPSVISLVMVTDEEDCSSRRMDHFVPGASPNGLNTRCYYEGLRGPESNLFQVQRYTDLFKMLRPGREDLVLFSAIAGVPVELVEPEVLADVNFANAAESAAFYDGILASEEMQQKIDDKQTPEVLDDDGIVPSCDRGADARAYPPRRIVEVAKAFGRNGLVQSICQNDFTDPINAIIDRIADHLGERCLDEPLEREGDSVACDVYWELPISPDDGWPNSCEDLPFLNDTNDVSSSGRKLCKIEQVPVVNGVVASSDDGFYYDDFSPDAELSCMAGTSKTRIAFTPSAQPPTGVTVWLRCD